MKPIEEVYPDAEQRYFGGYAEVIASMEHEILVQRHGGDYEGSSWYLLKDGDKVGYLEFGWGSCSGCDALEACHSRQEVAELRQSFYDGIRWETREDMLSYFTTKDWSTDWSWHYEEFKQFIAGVIAFLVAPVIVETGPLLIP